jgi:hypothetical protein
VGPITRSKAKQLEKEMHSQVNANLVLNNQIILDHPMHLSTCFNVLRNDGVHERAWDDDGFCPPNLWNMEPGLDREDGPFSYQADQLWMCKANKFVS